MTFDVDKSAQVTMAPRCPRCGSFNCAVYKSKGMIVEFEGRPHQAQKQYRKCREPDCQKTFSVVHIRGEAPKPTRRRPSAAT